MSTSVVRPDIDLLDPEFHVGDPHPAYRWMRANEPVYRDEHNGLWCITKHEHLRHVERQASTFVSSRGYRSIHVPHETSMISRDDPEHHEQRRLVGDHFSRRAVAGLEEEIRIAVGSAIDGFIDDGRVEVVDAFSARIPAIVTCRVLGWPEEHWRDIRSWSERFMRIDTMTRNPQHAMDGIAAVQELASLVDTTIPAKRACPAGDVLSAWAQADLPIEHINSELGLVIPGGAETTRTTLSRTFVLATERPDLWEAMATDPGGIATAVEELLRWITPLNNMFRTVAEATEVGGVAMAPGDRVALVYPSANRDEDVFVEPDELDLHRDPNPHVAFGIGTHFCLGAHVARLVLRVSLEELTSRLTDLRPLSPPVWEPNVFVKAVERFDVAFARR